MLRKVEASEKGIGDWVDFMQDALRVEAPPFHLFSHGFGSLRGLKGSEKGSKRAPKEQEKMGWSSSKVSSSWRLLQQVFEMLSMADLRHMSSWPLPQELESHAEIGDF